MIINSTALLMAEPIVDMIPRKVEQNGVSHGLGEVGYDIRLKQDIRFLVNEEGPSISVDGIWKPGRFTLASAVELFDMPENLMGIIHDKSSWARQGLSVFNTVVEPGWRGYLTLELVFHGNECVHQPAGCGIAQAVFHELSCPAVYDGKYQDQEDRPTETIFKG